MPLWKQKKEAVVSLPRPILMRKPYSIHMGMFECWRCGGHCNGIIHRCAAKSWKRRFIFSPHLLFLEKVNDPNTHPCLSPALIPIEDLWVILQRNAEQHLRMSSSRNRRGIVLWTCTLNARKYKRVVEDIFKTTILECLVNCLCLFLKPKMQINISLLILSSFQVF